MAGMFAAVGVFVATPAVASPIGDCRNYVVCLYNTGGQLVGQYSEYTDYYQQISRTDVASVKNATPGAVYFNYATGVNSCVLGGRTADLLIAGYGRVTGIRITSSQTCF